MRLTTLTLAIVAGSLITACGPFNSTQLRWEWEAFDKAEWKQTKDGVTVELREDKGLPPTFYATVQACNPNGSLRFQVQNKRREAVMEKVSYAQPDQLWVKVAITNQTDHVIYLNRVVVRYFDPSANQWEPLGKDDLNALLLSGRPCATTALAQAQFAMIKLIGRNTEVVPNTTTEGYMAFKPATLQMTGMWKFAVYEVPTEMDQAGNVTKRTRFELRTKVSKFQDSYIQDGIFSPKRLVKSEKLEGP